MNLKRLKELSISWSVKKKAQDIKDLVDIEYAMKMYLDGWVMVLIWKRINCL